MEADTSRQLWEADWEQIGKDLAAFTVVRLRNYRWRSGTIDILPEGMTLGDVVQKVITKALEGVRHWNPAKGPLVPWLKDQVKSIVDELCHSGAHLYQIAMVDDEHLPVHAASGIISITQVEAHPGGRAPSAEDMAIASQEKASTQARINALFEAVDGEPELEKILDLILGGCEPKPRAIAAATQTPVNEVNNQLKRLRRKAQQAL